MIKPLTPVITSHLFEPLSQELILLLKSLKREEWEMPVPGSKWNVRQVACHLLDGSLRRLSFHRDRHPLPKPETPIKNPKDLLIFLNSINRLWVNAAERLSPDIIVSMIDTVDSELSDFFKSLDPLDKACFPVAWAGETESENWFDIARDFTEKWYHQQQIREAVAKPLLNKKIWLLPVLDTFLRGLPHAFNISEITEISSININITRELEKTWSLIRESKGWHIMSGKTNAPETSISMSGDTAWRLFTGNLTQSESKNQMSVIGDPQPTEVVLRYISLMK